MQGPEPTRRKRKKRQFHPPVRQKHSLIDVSREFATEEQCLEYLEKMRWPDGVECVECSSSRISRIAAVGRTRINKKGETVQGPTRHLYQCLDCKHQFTATVGTVFADTHLPLEKWFQGIAIMCEAKKGVSALQMKRHLQIGSYKTAWFLNHRIREAMREESTAPLSGALEADETCIGGKYDKRRKRERWGKDPVFGIVERGGKVRTWHLPNVNRAEVIEKLKDHIEIETSTVFTDESMLYKNMPLAVQHEAVNHSVKEYVRGNIHTGTIDGHWSLLKRGIIGSFHKVGIKHLLRYLAEFQYRWNNRRDPDMFGRVVLGLLIQSTLEYAVLTGMKQPATSPAESDPSEEEPTL
jgi:hypothetical protein